MSKSKHNYSQYSKKTSDHKPVNTTAPIAPKSSSPEVKMEVEPNKTSALPVHEPNKTSALPVYELVKETVETVTLPKTVSGVVVKCAKLNIREEPSGDADVVCVLDVMSEIKIDPSKSDNEWLKVFTATGIEGYCMRKFVDARL